MYLNIIRFLSLSLSLLMCVSVLPRHQSMSRRDSPRGNKYIYCCNSFFGFCPCVYVCPSVHVDILVAFLPSVVCRVLRLFMVLVLLFWNKHRQFFFLSNANMLSHFAEFHGLDFDHSRVYFFFNILLLVLLSVISSTTVKNQMIFAFGKILMFLLLCTHS